jgi:aspartate/methionine/tyrosine aminotransferase
VVFVGLPAGGEEPEALVERLRLAHGLALVPGSPRWFGPGGAGHVRLCFATSEAILAEGLRRFSAGMAAAQPGRGSSG